MSDVAVKKLQLAKSQHDGGYYPGCIVKSGGGSTVTFKFEGYEEHEEVSIDDIAPLDASLANARVVPQNDIKHRSKCIALYAPDGEWYVGIIYKTGKETPGYVNVVFASFETVVEVVRASDVLVFDENASEWLSLQNEGTAQSSRPSTDGSETKRNNPHVAAKQETPVLDREYQSSHVNGSAPEKGGAKGVRGRSRPQPTGGFSESHGDNDNGRGQQRMAEAMGRLEKEMNTLRAKNIQLEEENETVKFKCLQLEEEHETLKTKCSQLEKEVVWITKVLRVMKGMDVENDDLDCERDPESSGEGSETKDERKQQHQRHLREGGGWGGGWGGGTPDDQEEKSQPQNPHIANPINGASRSAPAHYNDLVEAIEAKDVDAVRNFLRNGSDPNKPDDLDTYPLTAAVGKNSLEMVRMLVDAGADQFLATDDTGRRPAEVAEPGSSIHAFLKSIETPEQVARWRRNLPVADKKGKKSRRRRQQYRPPSQNYNNWGGAQQWGHYY
eukprot:CAMPEP_0167775544 /NCGR_PEP_ID=MMETSP0111_2-20121227/2623_1 /TAXON_ID=91324 /ORGANISM="Lotharella globosa, Strain CCCM811" /LENGTH=498 /DNA_ID=CAMNT_0007665481 /DNA_START=48 /DNA_END=1544 /DNA_ORIENTATION=-